MGLLLQGHRRHCEKCWSRSMPPFLEKRKLWRAQVVTRPLLRTESDWFCRPKSVLSFPHPQTSCLWPDSDIWSSMKNLYLGDFPGGPVVKNSPCNASDAGLIPGWRAKIPQASEQLIPCAATPEAQVPQLEGLYTAMA